MITTKNRLVDLRRTYRLLQQLDLPPLEVLITIDGSTEDVHEAVKAALQQARVFLNRIGHRGDYFLVQAIWAAFQCAAQRKLGAAPRGA